MILTTEQAARVYVSLAAAAQLGRVRVELQLHAQKDISIEVHHTPDGGVRVQRYAMLPVSAREERFLSLTQFALTYNVA